MDIIKLLPLTNGQFSIVDADLFLRTADKYQNAQNSKKHKRGKPHSHYKGVWKSNTGKWVSQITANGKRFHVGTFRTEKDAAKAYNNASRQYHGTFSKPNPLN